MKIFHLVEPSEWSAALAAGIYEPPSLAAQGFIHFSFEGQVLASANRHYAGADALLVVVYDSEVFGDSYVVEDTSGHGDYPHIYQAIVPAQALQTIALKYEENGWHWS